MLLQVRLPLRDERRAGAAACVPKDLAEVAHGSTRWDGPGSYSAGGIHEQVSFLEGGIAHLAGQHGDPWDVPPLWLWQPSAWLNMCRYQIFLGQIHSAEGAGCDTLALEEHSAKEGLLRPGRSPAHGYVRWLVHDR
jgi:hypothetical protein